jgi:hypothetical protein
MKFKAKIENLEIRGKEIKEGKSGEYAIIRLDDESGERLEFIDRNPERFDFYKRRAICDIWVTVTSCKDFTNFTICDMKIKDTEN